jgi:hypothetical protein
VWESKSQNHYLSPTLSMALLPFKNDLVPNSAKSIIALGLGLAILFATNLFLVARLYYVGKRCPLACGPFCWQPRKASGRD